MFSAGTGGYNDSERNKTLKALREQGNLDPNIVAVSLLVDTLQLMKKFEVSCSRAIWSRVYSVRRAIVRNFFVAAGFRVY